MQHTTVVSNSVVDLEVGLALVEEARPAPNRATQRLLGAYYTPQSAADYMADWVVRYEGEHILEPSVGDGTFLRAVAATSARRSFTAIRLTGVEIDEQARVQALQNARMAEITLRWADFLAVDPFPVQAVIGNPPYVRLRHLAEDQRQRALQAAKAVMEKPLDPASSIWMPFVLHSLRFLAVGGRLAFVLPYEFTYVRYAQPLWQALRANFGTLHVLRTHERLFPELLQDVVILLADNRGSHTDTVRYQAFERVADLLNSRPVVEETLRIDDLLAGKRVFVSALLGTELRRLLNTMVADRTVRARELVTFNIGYVAGDKTFFHPTISDVQQYRIAAHSLHPTLTAARRLKGAGLRTSALGAPQIDQLFLPDPNAVTTGERGYIATGAERGVAARYKCRIRDPWFIVPGVRVPDVVLSVFSERPLLLINDAGCFASNSLLCGYCKTATGEELVTGWYTSLTLLQCELEVHALGGGVMIMVPNEAGNIRLPQQVTTQGAHLNGLDHLLRHAKIQAAYEAGDGPVLRGQLGFSADAVERIRHGIAVLAHWRTSARTAKQ
ncbi:MAG: SAM-dependent methyltransferase [Chloroflexota bacterium]|nr:SAM-dependent methyltransferase [Chloroflexota bacterium]